MKTTHSILVIRRLLTLACLISVISTSSAGPKAPKPPPGRYEFKITGSIFTLPDHTAENGFSQCRENGLNNAAGIVQRKTTLDLQALGLGTVRKAITLGFGASAEPNEPATFSFWLTKNCELSVDGYVQSGHWPLADGEELTVIIPQGVAWTLNKVGGGSESCSGSPTLDEDAIITVHRNDARSADVCDCPFDYDDAEVANCP